MAQTNWSVELRWQQVAVAELWWCYGERGAALGEAERAGGSESGRVDGVAGVRCLSARAGLTGRANTGVLPPRGSQGLWPVGHDTTRGRGFRRRHRRLTVQLNDAILPNLFVHCKNFLNESCRAT